LEAGFSIGLVLGWSLMLRHASRIHLIIKALLAASLPVLLDALHPDAGIPAAWGLAAGVLAQSLFLLALRQRSVDHG
jgi:hypothetical protein